MQTFSRRVKLAEFLDITSGNGFEKDISFQPLVKSDSRFYLPKNTDKELDQHIDSLNNLHIENIKKSFKSNLNKREWIELNHFKNNPDIVIKKAYHGGAVPMLTARHYKQKIYAHLNDKKIYKKLECNTGNKTIKYLNYLFPKSNSSLNEKQVACFKNKIFESSNFCGLPKILKSEITKPAFMAKKKEEISFTEPSDLKVGPTLEDPKRPTRKLSYLMDLLSKLFIKKVQSYVKDSTTFLNKYQRVVCEKTKIVSFYGVSLFPIVSHKLGIEVINYLTNYETNFHSIFNNEFNLESVEFILKHNTLTFEEENFLEIQETAMCTIFAPTYASFTIAYVKIVIVIPRIYNKIITKYNIKKNMNLWEIGK